MNDLQLLEINLILAKNGFLIFDKKIEEKKAQIQNQIEKLAFPGKNIYFLMYSSRRLLNPVNEKDLVQVDPNKYSIWVPNIAGLNLGWQIKWS